MIAGVLVLVRASFLRVDMYVKFQYLIHMTFRLKFQRCGVGGEIRLLGRYSLLSAVPRGIIIDTS